MQKLLEKREAMSAAQPTPKRKTRAIFCLVGLLLMAALGVWELFANDTFFRQRMRLQQAREHIAKLTPLLATVTS